MSALAPKAMATRAARGRRVGDGDGDGNDGDDNDGNDGDGNDNGDDDDGARTEARSARA